MYHDLPSSPDSLIANRVFEEDATTWTNQMIGAGYCTDQIPTAAELGSMAAYIAMDQGFPFDCVLRLADRLHPFFRADRICGRTLFRAGLFLFSTRRQLLRGEVPPAPSQAKIKEDFYAIIQCVGVSPGESLKSGRLWEVRFLLMSTSLSGMEFTTRMPGGFVSSTIRAISRAAREPDACDPRFLYGLRMKAMLGMGRRGGLTIKAIASKESLHARNADIRRKRMDCPHAPCWTCPRGTDTCRFALKPETRTAHKEIK